MSSGRDLNGWAREWLETTGVNTLRPRFETDSSGLYTSFDVVQEAVPGAPDAALAPDRDRPLRPHGRRSRAAGAGRARRLRRPHRGAEAARRPPARPAAAQRRRPHLREDPARRALARRRRSSRSARSSESLPRALLWGAAWDMTRDAEMAARDFLRLVLGGIRPRTTSAWCRRCWPGRRWRSTRTATRRYRASGSPAAHRRRLRACMQSAAPGSDHQLALLYTFATAEDPAGLDRVRAILDGQRAAARPGARHRAALAPADRARGARPGRRRRHRRRAGARRHGRRREAGRVRAHRDADGRGQGGGVGGRRRPRRAVQPHAGGDDAHVLALRAGAARGHRAVRRQVLRRRRRRLAAAFDGLRADLHRAAFPVDA